MHVLDYWQKLNRYPAGAFLFSKLLGRMAPYTGSISPRVMEIREGYARVAMDDRRGVRNHLKSIHAIALMNIAEVSTGLALLSATPRDARAILKGLSIEYLKKARGTITAEATHEKISSNESKDYFVETVLKNEGGEIVAKAKAHWLVGPQKQS